jgi:hypothetical protein
MDVREWLEFTGRPVARRVCDGAAPICILGSSRILGCD